VDAALLLLLPPSLPLLLLLPVASLFGSTGSTRV
jgi:hypothetical protein